MKIIPVTGNPSSVIVQTTTSAPVQVNTATTSTPTTISAPLAGARGPAGKDGATILAGNGGPGIDLGKEGDYYLDRVTAEFYGPKVGLSWGIPISLSVTDLNDLEDVVITEDLGTHPNSQESLVFEAGDDSWHNQITKYTHYQLTPSTTWTVVHNMGRRPTSVTVYDSSGSEVIGNMNYIDANTVQLSFSAAFSGSAYIS